MFVKVGESKFGKVDHLPGLFYIATSFFHINYIPIIPVGCYAVEDWSGGRSVNIGFDAKSVFLGYVRCYSLVVAIIVTIACLLYVVGSLIKGIWAEPAWEVAGVGIIAWLVFLTSYLLGKPKLSRMLRAAAALGMAPETLAKHVAVRSQLNDLFAKFNGDKNRLYDWTGSETTESQQ